MVGVYCRLPAQEEVNEVFFRKLGELSRLISAFRNPRPLRPTGKSELRLNLSIEGSRQQTLKLGIHSFVGPDGTEKEAKDRNST